MLHLLENFAIEFEVMVILFDNLLDNIYVYLISEMYDPLHPHKGVREFGYRNFQSKADIINLPKD